MNKKIKHLLSLAVLFLVLVCAGAWWFVNGVRDQLWESAIRTVVESTHQEANALDSLLETDYKTLGEIWSALQKSQDPWGEMERWYRQVEPDVQLYVRGELTAQMDRRVTSMLELERQERGLLRTHINSATGLSVFNIFLGGALPDGREAVLVKEYRAREVADQFALSFYDDNGFSYLVDRSGAIMARPWHKDGNKTLHSLFDLIPQEGNDPEMVQLFQDSIWRRKTGWTKFDHHGTRLVFCYEPLWDEGEWLLVSVIPEQVLTAQGASILKKTLLFSGATTAMVLILVMTYFASKMKVNARHTQELQGALDAADRANEVKGRFLMDMSHDIRTPLNAILGMTAVARQNSGNQEKVEDALGKIEGSGVHLLSVVSDVLDMSQIEQGKLILREEPIHLPRFFQETVELVRPKAVEAGLTLECAPVQLEEETVLGDKQRLRQVLLNVMGNAVKYTPAGGHVSVELTQGEEKRYRFRCADTGIGMEKEFQERVFLPFERARNTTASKIPGTGVGLTITKKLLDLMDGKIGVESALGKGSVFTVELPLAPAPEGDAALEEADYPGRRVLLVEDNALNLEIMEELLQLTGVEIETAADGSEAVEKLQSAPEGYYDLIFMDIQMPVMDGYEATRRIRAMERADVQRLPIYAVSANALAEDVKNSMDAGMDGHIPKPVEMAAIEKVMRRCFG